MLQAEYNELKEEDLKGTLGFDEKQARKDLLHNKLLDLVRSGPPAGVASPGGNRLLWGFISLGVLAVAAFVGYSLQRETHPCPGFPEGFEHRIMVMPFDQERGTATSGGRFDEGLADQLVELANAQGIPCVAKVGKPASETMSLADGPVVAQQCDASMLIWGSVYTEGNRKRIYVKYAFASPFPQGDMVRSLANKNSSDLQTGEFTHSLEDALLHLCGMLALNENDPTLAKKWFENIQEKTPKEQLILAGLGE